MRNRKTKQQLVDDNEQAARIALYLPQLHAQKEKLEADLQELEHLALSGWGYADFHAGVNFAITEFSEVRPQKLPLGICPSLSRH
ncbi:MAG: hypothetical protein H0T55_01275 [Rubrobacteraceae bacterium]|nr:hypothetical protein [Rubrobacteraceae bacterium]